MLFAMDIGNTNIKCGIFRNGELAHSFRVACDIDSTADEYGVKMKAFFSNLGLDPEDVTGAIVSSVVPSVNYTIDHMMRYYFGIHPMFVTPGIKTGLNIKTEVPKELGADRIVNAVAAYELYGGPCVTVDFGTATTFGVISKEGDFLGGAICPGIKIATEALTNNAAKLPRVELNFPDSVIGKNPVSNMQAGILYGYVGQVEHIITKIREEIGPAKVIATGGFSHLIAQHTGMIDEIVPTLTLIGLSKIYEKNRKGE